MIELWGDMDASQYRGQPVVDCYFAADRVVVDELVGSEMYGGEVVMRDGSDDFSGQFVAVKGRVQTRRSAVPGGDRG
ncbi:MAG: hypothetical protein GX216_04850 [Methanomicrobiales archaeon]|nr:hypothetical protein [Methanomicrobiales archaeon]